MHVLGSLSVSVCAEGSNLCILPIGDGVRTRSVHPPRALQVPPDSRQGALLGRSCSAVYNMAMEYLEYSLKYSMCLSSYMV